MAFGATPGVIRQDVLDLAGRPLFVGSVFGVPQPPTMGPRLWEALDGASATGASGFRSWK